MPRIYRADHTAHIRNRLKNQALYFSTGAIVAALGAGTVAAILSLSVEAPHTLTVMGWGLVIVAVLVSGTGLIITGIQYLAYRRRRAELDAAGAEATGELRARHHRPGDNG